MSSITLPAINGATAQEPYTAPKPLALLPAPLLQAAAIFASTDKAKQALFRINVRAESGRIRLAATNGHYACRFYVPSDGTPDAPAWVSDTAPEFNLDAKPILKRCAYAKWAEVRTDGEVRFLGGRKAASEFLESRNAGDPLPPYGFEFPPAFDSLWPDSYSNTPGALIAFNADYMATICEAIARLTDGNQVARLETNSPHAPLRLSCVPADPWGDCVIEFLLMPVQVRS